MAECETLGDNLLALNRAIFEMERQLEWKPSQIELNQYQRRFVELHNQSLFEILRILRAR